MKALLIAGGTLGNSEKLKALAKVCDVIICADHGYDYAARLGVVPDILIGDMDSIECGGADIEKYVYPTHKDYTDSELIMDYAAEKGYDELYLFGFTGTRLDHTLANLSFLCRYDTLDAVIIDDFNEIRAAKRENIICGKKGDLVSVIPLGGNLEGVTTENLEYALSDGTISFGTSLGVSNVMTADICRVSIRSGSGLIIKSTD